MRVPSVRALLVLAVTASVTLTGCSSSPEPSPGASATRAATSSGASAIGRSAPPMPTVQAGAACLTPAERVHDVRFTSGNGASIAGVVLGPQQPPTATKGLVLAHQSSATLCDWIPYARVLAAKGWTVLAIDLSGFGASQASRGFPGTPGWDDDVIAAVGVLRARGVRPVAVMGATLGALATVVAASRITPPVAAVVNVSSPTDLSGLDGVAAASRLTVPLLSIAGASDEYVSNVRAVSAAAVRAPVNQLLIVPGSGADGVNLLDPAGEPTAARTRAAIEAFLAAHLN